jgi:hypothetical protein
MLALLGSSPALAQTRLECRPDTQACVSACQEAGEMSHPVVQCMRACREYNAGARGYCFPRYAERGRRPSWQAKEEYHACVQAECRGPMDGALRNCMAGKTEDDVRAGRTAHCANAGFGEFRTCVRSCLRKVLGG